MHGDEVEIDLERDLLCTKEESVSNSGSCIIVWLSKLCLHKVFYDTDLYIYIQYAGFDERDNAFFSC